MAGYDLSRTLAGYGLQIETVLGEDLSSLYTGLCRTFGDNNPRALVIMRKWPRESKAPKAARMHTKCSRSTPR